MHRKKSCTCLILKILVESISSIWRTPTIGYVAFVHTLAIACRITRHYCTFGCSFQFVFRQLLQRAEERKGYTFHDMQYQMFDNAEPISLTMTRVPVSPDDGDVWPPGIRDSEGRCVVVSNGQPWKVPLSGTVKMLVTFARARASTSNVVSVEGFGNLVEVSTSGRRVTAMLRWCSCFGCVQLVQAEDLDVKTRVKLVELLSDDADLTCRQAKTVLNMSLIQQQNEEARVHQLARMLCRVVDHANIAPLLDSTLRASGKRVLEKYLGNMFRLVVKNPTGHYRFDLELPGDR